MRTLFILALSFFLSSCAQRLDEFEQRIDSLDERARALESASGIVQDTDKNLLEGRRVADLRLQVSTLRNEVTVLKGQVENLEFTNRALTERLTALESRTQSPREASPSQTVAPRGSDAAYQAAIRAHQGAQYDRARVLFLKFLEEFPSDPLADNALFWVAEGHRLQDQHREALLRYQDLIEKYPQSDKRCEAMARQVEALKHLGMEAEARGFAEVMNAECPQKKN